ncbi:hypothetical protein BY996DRAFT_4577840 [Phakopsora pachyrhizi]|uniref:F-box domain-containing protein n=1 Tax=Phakopsora pachyrhizi TaxID=170000 RepID=A0AAV0BLU7_PHAPC|nr:hypothetical protein BY996DRAFT_4577840 [Phakopsora pachyrhizi]CAH7687312.1 hypothetical protein PPACK8108_LOCUS22084 [Phakopsora pachyrhizi]
MFNALVQRQTRENLFERLPDEIVTEIIEWLSRGSNPVADPDPFKLGWNEEEEVMREILGAEEALKPIRLVSKRFLRLSAPAFFRKLYIGSRNGGGEFRTGKSITRLTELLSKRPACFTEAKPYGHSVQRLVVMNRNESPAYVFRLLDAIHTLIPNLKELSSLDLSQFFAPLSPIIKFPSLEALTQINAPDSPEERTLGDDLALVTSDLSSLRSSNSQENFFSLLNHHPCIRRISIREIKLDYKNSVRLSTLLRFNNLTLPLLQGFRQTAQLSGLTDLHLGYQSQVDVYLLQILPSVASKLQRLHIDAGCKLEDKSHKKDKNWNLIHLIRSLPELSHFSFVSKREVPWRNGSSDWKSLGQVLEVAPQLKHLNVRLDSIEGWGFFESLGKTELKELRLWHEPIISTGEIEAWSIISFGTKNSLRSLAKISFSLLKTGMEWPLAENSRRDLIFKLEHLIKVTEKIEC